MNEVMEHFVPLTIERENGNVRVSIDTSLAEDLGMSLEHIKDVITDVVNKRLDETSSD